MCTVLFVTLGTLGSGAGAGAATVTWPVSTGADGALSLPGGSYVFDTTIGRITSNNGAMVVLPQWNSPTTHAWNFTSLTIATGANVVFAGNNLPDVRVVGDATISGTINLDGAAGASPAGGLPGSSGGSGAFAGQSGLGNGGAGGAHGQGG